MRHLTCALALAGTLALSGACASVLPIITTITSIAAEAVAWVDLIADFVAKAPVDEALRGKIDQAVQRARVAAIVLQRAGRGADELSREQLEAAFVSFREAYEALLQLVAPLGVRQVLPEGGRLGNDGDGRLLVPPASSFAVPRS